MSTSEDLTAIARQITGFDVDRQHRAVAAVAACAAHLPDLNDKQGRPCTFAVDAYLRLKGATDRDVTPAAVRNERRKLLDGHKARHGYDPTEAPAGHLATKAGGRADSMAGAPAGAPA